MSQKFTITILASVLILGSIGIFQDASASSVKICDDETISTGIFKSIKVAEGKSCTISGDTVIEKNLTANGANSIIVDSASSVNIGGNVKITNSLGTIQINNAEIDGNVKLENNFDQDILITNSHIGKNLVLKNNSIDDSVAFPFYKIYLRDSIVDGDAIFDNNTTGDDILLHTNTINGKVVLKNNTVLGNDILLYFNTVNKNIQFVNNYADGQIDLLGNTVSGNVNLKGNETNQTFLLQQNIIDGTFSIKQQNAEMADLIVTNNDIGKDLKIVENTQNNFNLSTNTVKNNILIQKNNSVDVIIFQNNSDGPFVVKNNTVESTLGGSIGLYLFDNSSLEKIVVKKNIIETDLWCTGNSPDPINKKNIVGGSLLGQCGPSNSPPSIGSVSIDEEFVGATLNDVILTCLANGINDADGDNVSLTYLWTNSGGDVLGTENVLEVTNSAGSYTCEVTPFDGTDFGVPVSAVANISSPGGL